MPWNSAKQGAFITVLCQDREGDIFVGTEDFGVWEWNGQSWRQFTEANTQGGLGDDDIYSLTCDRLGRIWAGTDRHGVCVFNGKIWQDYERVTGPLGCHVIALATSPIDGDVWGATEAGLFRYSLHDNLWAYYNRAEGLPSDQADSLAFAKNGTLFVGTLCSGIAIASPADDYKTWRTVTGPSAIPDTPGGAGLPTNQINCLYVAHDGTVYAGTTTGLARSSDNGKTWRFLRGADWKAKLAGLYHPVPPVKTDTNHLLLSGDYITALAEDDHGHLYLGHRQTGLGRYNEFTEKGDTSKSHYSGYVDCLLTLRSGKVLIGTYGDGLRWTEANSPSTPILRDAGNLVHMLSGARGLNRGQEHSVPFPALAKPPTLARLKALLVQLNHISSSPQTRNPVIETLDDDWRTQGYWIDHYGNFAAILCDMNGGGNDDLRGYRSSYIDFRSWIGRNGGDDDYLRNYVLWQPGETNDPRVLQDPLLGGLKESEWDDHGEVKSRTLDGPNVYCTIFIPQGHYILSFYMYNKDGHSGDNSNRDFTITVRSTSMSKNDFKILGLPSGSSNGNAESIFDHAPDGATSRVAYFWSGVYKRFYIGQPSDNYITVQIKRNYSKNTTISGIFLDPIGPEFGPAGPRIEPAIYTAPTFSPPPGMKAESTVLGALIRRLTVLRDTESAWYALNSPSYLPFVIPALFTQDKSGSTIYADIAESGSYPHWNRDVSICLNDLQLFRARDQIYFSEEHMQTWTWLCKTKLGEEDNWNFSKYVPHWKFDVHAYNHYIDANRKKDENLDLVTRGEIK